MTPLEPGGQSLNPSHLVVSALKMSLSKRLTVVVLPVSSFAGHLWQPSRRGWIHSVRKNGQDLDPLTRDQMSESECLDQETLILMKSRLVGSGCWEGAVKVICIIDD